MLRSRLQRRRIESAEKELTDLKALHKKAVDLAKEKTESLRLGQIPLQSRSVRKIETR